MRSTAAAQQRNTGFTLIELMITVAVVAILAAIAYPSYGAYLRTSRRAQAMQTLMNIASRQQQYLLDTRTYAGTLDTLQVTVEPSITSSYSFTMAVGADTVPSFTVTAAPLGAQAADSCGSVSLAHTGVKAPTACW